MALLVAGVAATFWPGVAMYDTVAQYGQVLSGEVEPRGYLQGEDEWALVLSGGAALEIDGATVELAPHDWVFLPAGTPHRVLRTEPGTSWITVKLAPAAR